MNSSPFTRARRNFVVVASTFLARLSGLATGEAAALELGEEIRMMDVKIELEADALRSRLIEQEKVESTRIDALRRGAGLVTPEAQAPFPSRAPATDYPVPVVPGVRAEE